MKDVEVVKITGSNIKHGLVIGTWVSEVGGLPAILKPEAGHIRHPHLNLSKPGFMCMRKIWLWNRGKQHATQLTTGQSHIYIWPFFTIISTITVILFTVPLLLGEQFHANCGWLWQATNDQSNCRGVFTNQSGNTQCSLVNSGHEGVADQSLGLSHSTFSNWFLSGGYQPPATTLMNTLPLESLFGVNLDALFWTEELQSYFRPPCRIKWLALYQK